MEKADGRLVMGQNASFDPSTYDTILHNGYPYYLREKSSDRDLGAGITTSPAYPYGLTIEATANKDGSHAKIVDVAMEKIRSLASKYSLVVLKGFQTSEHDGLREKITELARPGYVVPRHFPHRSSPDAVHLRSNAPILQTLERRDGESIINPCQPSFLRAHLHTSSRCLGCFGHSSSHPLRQGLAREPRQLHQHGDYAPACTDGRADRFTQQALLGQFFA